MKNSTPIAQKTTVGKCLINLREPHDLAFFFFSEFGSLYFDILLHKLNIK